MPHKVHEQAVKAPSSPKAKFLGELDHEDQEFIDIPHPAEQAPVALRKVPPAMQKIGVRAHNPTSKLGVWKKRKNSRYGFRWDGWTIMGAVLPRQWG